MIFMNKFTNVVAWILLCVTALGASLRAYAYWIVHTHIYSTLIFVAFLILIFWTLFKIFDEVGIWTNKEGHE